jgi:hypothetical protein
MDKSLVFDIELLVAGIILQERHSNDTAFNTKYEHLINIIQDHPALPVDEASAMMQRVANHFTLAMIKGDTLTEFNKKMYDLITVPGSKITLFHSGILKYLVGIDTNQRRTQEINDLGYRSKFVGKVGEKLSLTLKILKCTRVHSPGQYDFYSAIAISEDGDLFNFSPKEVLNPTDDYSCKLTGKVKSHHSDQYLNGFCVTRLNYCKFLDAVS